MQKKLIALAVAGLAATGAYAQSNVTIYGVADGSFEQVKATGVTPNAANTNLNYGSRQRVNSNNSLIGFKGAESLGNGLTAVFQFETNVNLGGANATTGTTTGSNLFVGQRDTFVGLAGGFGTVAAGFLSTPTRSTLVQFDVMPGATGAGGINALLGRINVGGALSGNGLTAAGTTANTFGTSVGGVVSNNQNTVFRTTALAYITPTFQGLTGTLAYVPNAAKDLANANNTANNANTIATAATRNQSAWNASLNYANGPLKVGYAYLDVKDADLLNANGGNTVALTGLGYNLDSKLKTHILGASYTMGDLMVSAVYDKTKAELGQIATVAAAGQLQEVSRNAWYLGAKYTLGANEFAASYARIGDNNTQRRANANANAATSDKDTGAQQYSLRYGYNFSKRTQAYALYTKVKNDRNGNFDVFNGSGAPSTLGAGADPQVLGVGLRHSF